MITQYSNFAFGVRPVSKLYQGDTLVWPFNNVPTVPGPDIMLNWISNGNASSQPHVYFDTQFIPDISTNIEIKYSVHDEVDYSGLFGAQDWEIDPTHDTPSQGESAICYNMMLRGPIYTWSSKSFATVVNYNEVGHRLINNSSHVLKNGVSLGNVALGVPHTFTLTQNMNNTSAWSKCTIVNDTSIYRNNPSSPWVDYPSSSIYLFAINKYNTGPIYYASSNTRIYYVKIYNEHTLYRFMIPVLHYDDSKQQYVACFYDKVSNTYFYNLGTDNVKYQVQGDFILDYIERDDSGYLTYMTGTDVSIGVLTNIGLTVSDSNTILSTLTQNLVVGTAINEGGPIQDSSTGYGFLLPAQSNTTRLGYVGLGGVITGNYDYATHVRNKHHADNMSCLTYERHRNNSTSWVKEYYSHMTLLEFAQGVLPNSSHAKIDTTNSHSYSASLPTIGREIGLFGDNNMHAHKSTKIYYADITNYELNPASSSDANWYINKPCHSYIPVLHEGLPCFYDFITGARIYNTGTGTPNYDVIGYPIDYVPDDTPVDPPVIPDAPPGTYVLEPVDLGLSVNWASCNLGATSPTDNGYLYPWGYIEPTGGSLSSWDEYKWYDSSTKTVTKYIYSKSTLNNEDDAAYVVNHNWRIPTPAEFEELKNNTVRTIENINGVYYVKHKSTVPGYTKNYIYFPAPITLSTLKCCFYWTNTAVVHYANYTQEMQRIWAAAMVLQTHYEFDIIYLDQIATYWPTVHWALAQPNVGYAGYMPRCNAGFIRPVCSK